MLKAREARTRNRAGPRSRRAAPSRSAQEQHGQQECQQPPGPNGAKASVRAAPAAAASESAADCQETTEQWWRLRAGRVGFSWQCSQRAGFSQVAGRADAQRLYGPASGLRCSTRLEYRTRATRRACGQMAKLVHAPVRRPCRNSRRPDRVPKKSLNSSIRVSAGTVNWSRSVPCGSPRSRRRRAHRRSRPRSPRARPRW